MKTLYHNIFITKDGVVRSYWALLLGIASWFCILALMALPHGVYATYAIYILGIVVILGLWKLLYKKPFADMGLSLFRLWQHILWGLIFGASFILLVFVILVTTGCATITSISANVFLHVGIWLGLLKYIFVGFLEELLVRGYMMSVLKTTRNRYIVFFLPALIFSFLHIFNPSMGVLPIFNISLMGLFLAYIFIKTGDIWMCVGFHIAFNFFQGYIFGYEVSGNATNNSLINLVDNGPALVTGGAFGPEGGLIITFVALMGLIFVHFCVKGKKHSDFWEIKYQ